MNAQVACVKIMEYALFKEEDQVVFVLRIIQEKIVKQNFHVLIHFAKIMQS
jgi:hypothetical protein